ncbi:unnamed protein product [Paramecium primaurelia]|uniref:Uncharacterized protein n=1 Tax=Paramecium primaurelia TaxID=5886 RepID=A0A8S1MM03_PARPR|nr:unnamed protein product [Paramecium primaurelia]CAD8102949.1 unnamed protein product [Paramecium primaurelia]
MDNLLTALITHLIDSSNPDYVQIMSNYECFRSIINSNIDASAKAFQIEKFLQSLKPEQRHTHRSSNYDLQPRSKQFNSSIVLVEAKLFEKKFQQHTQEIEEMLSNL